MSLLKITYPELQRSIARHLGFDRNSAHWSADEETDINDVIARGETMFYWFPQIEGIASHKWSFLCPTEVIAFQSGVEDYPLPKDYIRMGSKFTFAADSKIVSLAEATEHDIRNLRSVEAMSGKPRYYAIRPKSQDENSV